MTKRRELVKLIQKLVYDESLFFIHSIQRRPYTYVMVSCTRRTHTDGNITGSLVYQGHGFSKVMRPDKWDAQKGKILATDKACVDLADHVVGRGDAVKMIADLEHSRTEDTGEPYESNFLGYTTGGFDEANA